MVVGVVGVGLGEDARAILEPLPRPPRRARASGAGSASAASGRRSRDGGSRRRCAASSPPSRSHSTIVRASPAVPVRRRASRGRCGDAAAGAAPRDEVVAADGPRRAGGRRREAPRRAGRTRVAHLSLGEHVLGIPALLPPFSAARSTGIGDPQPPAHHAEAVTDGEERGVRLARIASKSAKSGASQAGSSTMPWAPVAAVVAVRVDVARARRCRCRSRSGRPAPPGSCGADGPRRRSRGCPVRLAASSGARSQAASWTAWTSESWPRFGQPWFMSSTATSMTCGSAGAGPPRARRAQSGIRQPRRGSGSRSGRRWRRGAHDEHNRRAWYRPRAGAAVHYPAIPCEPSHALPV